MHNTSYTCAITRTPSRAHERSGLVSGGGAGERTQSRATVPSSSRHQAHDTNRPHHPLPFLSKFIPAFIHEFMSVNQQDHLGLPVIYWQLGVTLLKSVLVQYAGAI